MSACTCTPDHRDKWGQFHATGTGHYPADYSFEVYFPVTWSEAQFYWFAMEVHMRRYCDHTWWSYTLPGPPAVYRVKVHEFTQTELL